MMIELSAPDRPPAGRRTVREGGGPPCVPGGVKDPAGAGEVRRFAAAIKGNPLPVLTRTDLCRRWGVSYPTVDRVLKAAGIKPAARTQGGHGLYCLGDILSLEGVDDPGRAWALGSEEDRKLLRATLVDIEVVRRRDRRLTPQHEESVRRAARTGLKPGIKIGAQWRFRRTVEELESPDDDGNDDP